MFYDTQLLYYHFIKYRTESNDNIKQIFDAIGISKLNCDVI